MTKKKQKPGKPLPPTQIPEVKVGETHVLRPEIVRDPDIIVQTKKDANEKRHLAAQLPDKVLAAIYGYLDRHPVPKNHEIARWLKNDPEIAPFVLHLTVPSLAKKIGKLRK